MPADARIIAVGLNHRTAPVEVRERLAFDEAAVREQLGRLRTLGICDEALLVSTCNRVELYAVATHDPGPKVRDWLHGFTLGTGQPIDPFVAWWRDREAISHLFRVAGSLDSMVVGEPQILGQVKDAVRLAEETGALGRTLGNLARKSLTVAKRIRSETAIGRYRVGIGNAGVDLAKRIFGDLRGKKALLLGVGEMGRQVAAALLQEGLAELCVCNRTFEKAAALAQELGSVATAASWEALEERLHAADIVITAVGGADPVVKPDLVRRAMRRRWDPLFLVDLGVPRNIDQAVSEIDEAYLFNVDDLQKVLEEGKAARDAASNEALRIVEEEVDAFLVSLREIEIGPLMGTVSRHAEEMRLAELARSKKLIESLSDDQRAQLDVMTKAMVKRLLDNAMRSLREAAKRGDNDRVDLIVGALTDNRPRGGGSDAT